MKFPKLVIDEARALKEHATKEEISALDFSNLNPEHSQECIYGQMTGSCWSDRAGFLIKTCAKRVYKEGGGRDGVFQGAILNGSPVNESRGSFWSPIEVFISRNKHNGQDEKNQKLIQFIKGEIKSL